MHRIPFYSFHLCFVVCRTKGSERQLSSFIPLCIQYIVFLPQCVYIVYSTIHMLYISGGLNPYMREWKRVKKTRRDHSMRPSHGHQNITNHKWSTKTRGRMFVTSIRTRAQTHTAIARPSRPKKALQRKALTRYSKDRQATVRWYVTE